LGIRVRVFEVGHTGNKRRILAAIERTWSTLND